MPGKLMGQKYILVKFHNTSLKDKVCIPEFNNNDGIHNFLKFYNIKNWKLGVKT